VGVGREHRGRRVPDAGGDHVDRDPVGQHQGDCAVAQNVQAPGEDARGPAELREPLGEPLRVNRVPELVAEDEILVLVAVAGKVPLGLTISTVSSDIAYSRSPAASRASVWRVARLLLRVTSGPYPRKLGGLDVEKRVGLPRTDSEKERTGRLVIERML
jgi:hypothetical protein